MIKLLIIIVVVILIGYLLMRTNEPFVEALSNNEAVSNIASIYNTDKMAVTNLNVTGEAKAGKLLVNTDQSNNQVYDHDVGHALNDINTKLTDLIKRFETVEKNYVDKTKAFSLGGTTYDNKQFGLLPGTGKIYQ